METLTHCFFWGGHISLIAEAENEQSDVDLLLHKMYSSADQSLLLDRDLFDKEIRSKNVLPDRG